MTYKQLARLAATCWLAVALAPVALADGGALRAMERSGGMQIAAFTSPNPLVGPAVDVSVLVQYQQTLEVVPQATVTVTLTPRDRPYGAMTLEATTETATNKLMRDCHATLEPGVYQVEVICTAGERLGSVQFAMEVAPQPTQAARLWPWFTWPAVPIVLFGLHQHLARKTPARRQYAV